jgi:hypothetical protein
MLLLKTSVDVDEILDLPGSVAEALDALKSGPFRSLRVVNLKTESLIFICKKKYIEYLY